MFRSNNSSGTAMNESEHGHDNLMIEKVEAGPDAQASTQKENDSETDLHSDTQAPPGPPPGSDGPDGGTRAWLVVLGAWCTSFCSFGWINSVGVFQEYYEATLLKQFSTSTISWIPSLQIFFMMAMGPVVGILYDKFGPRHLLFVGTILHVFGLMMTSISHNYYQILLSQGVCSAIGVSAIFQPALNSIPGWFTTKRGAAFGILATGSSLGGVIFPIMVSRLIKEVGFAWSIRISAFLILALLVVANLTVKSFHPPVSRTIGLKQFFGPFREVQFMALTLGLLLFTFGLYVPINYIPIEAAAAGMDPNLVQYLIPILNAASLFGRAGSGFAGDKFGRYNVFIVVCYFSGIWVLALWIPAATTAARIAFSALFGFFSGAYVALIAALVVGFRTGIVFFASSFGGLTTNPINGSILSSSGWLGPKIFAGVFCITGTCFILAARIHKTGWKLMAVF
ncbi:MFS transporter asaE [Cladobotryum mycophilum]|uniref:MFS transporter asaE n=1 Tax=Cladobotryum mycophilum TaxID=491253 RepID=A0ABR0SBQ2_9HYPO